MSLCWGYACTDLPPPTSSRACEGCFPEHSPISEVPDCFMFAKLLSRKWCLGEGLICIFLLSELKHCFICLRALCLLFCELSLSLPILPLFLVPDSHIRKSSLSGCKLEVFSLVYHFNFAMQIF